MSTIKRKAQGAAKYHNPKPPKYCSECGDEVFLVRHHSDYARPLLITWLCRSCHGNFHKKGLPSSGQAIDYSNTESNPEKAIRLDPDNEELLNAVKAGCPWGVSLCRLGNQAIRAGTAELKRSFNPKSSTKKKGQ